MLPVLYPLVRQLIKSQRVQNKLGVVFEKEKDRTQRKDFIFVSARVSIRLGLTGDWWVPTGDFPLGKRRKNLWCGHIMPSARGELDRVERVLRVGGLRADSSTHSLPTCYMLEPWM